MARIELKHCTVRIKDGLSGTGLVNQLSSPPAQDDSTLTIDGVVLNTLTPQTIPVGARFRMVQATGPSGPTGPAGETVPVDHVVQSCTLGSGSGTNEQDTVTVTGGTKFTLTFLGQTTTDIDVGAADTDVKAALVALDDGYLTGDFAVTGATGPYVVTFQGALAAAPQILTGASTGGAIGIVRTVHGLAPVPTTTTISIVFAPALGEGSYADNEVITFKPQQIDIKIGDGDIKYTEASDYKYDKDRGQLDTVREGDEMPMDVSLNFTFEHVKTGTSEQITPIDAIKGINGAAGWVSSSDDPCEPYAVDVEIENNPPCSVAYRETWVFPDFRCEKRDYDYKNAAIAATGKCNVTEPEITRG